MKHGKTFNLTKFLHFEFDFFMFYFRLRLLVVFNHINPYYDLGILKQLENIGNSVVLKK